VLTLACAPKRDQRGGMTRIYILYSLLSFRSFLEHSGLFWNISFLFLRHCAERHCGKVDKVGTDLWCCGLCHHRGSQVDKEHYKSFTASFVDA